MLSVTDLKKTFTIDNGHVGAQRRERPFRVCDSNEQQNQNVF